MQNLGGKKCIMGNSKIENGKTENSSISYRHNKASLSLSAPTLTYLLQNFTAVALTKCTICSYLKLLFGEKSIKQKRFLK